MKIFLSLLGVLFALECRAQGPQCSGIFSSALTPSQFGILRPYYDLTVKTVDASAIETTSFFRSSQEGLTRTDIQALTTSPATTEARNHLEKIVSGNIDFVVSEYAQRRDWNAQYISGIRKDAFAFADRATYFSVRRLEHPDAEGTLIGTLKVIRGNRQSPLPLEVEHGISLPTNGNRKYEPGNFVILKEHNQMAFSEVMLQLINFAKQVSLEHGHVPEKMVFFTDADRASAIMYKKLGFTAVPGFEKPLIKDNKEYHLIGASAESILRFPEIFRKNRGEWAGDHKMGFQRLAEILNTYDLSRADVRGRSFSALKIFDRKGLPPGENPLTTHISLPRETDRGPGLRISIDRQGNPGVQANYVIPESAVPLRDGMILTVRAGLQISFQHGVLVIRDRAGQNEEVFHLQTDSNLQEISGVKYQFYKNNELFREIRSY